MHPKSQDLPDPIQFFSFTRCGIAVQDLKKSQVQNINPDDNVFSMERRHYQLYIYIRVCACTACICIYLFYTYIFTAQQDRKSTIFYTILYYFILYDTILYYMILYYNINAGLKYLKENCQFIPIQQ